MSETGAIKQALDPVQRLAKANGHPVAEDGKKSSSFVVPAAAETHGSAHTDIESSRHDPVRASLFADEARAPETAPSRQAAPHAIEIELKLIVPADRLADFNDAPIIAANARNKGTRKHLKAVYYDTPKRTLRREGFSFRVRQSGTRFTQTVKAESGNDPLRRGEWEASVPSMTPDLALAMTLVPEKLRADLERHSVEAVFSSDIHRHQRLVELPSGTVEVAFDRGHLISGDRSLPVSEIELELKSGSPSAIWELARRLAEHGPVKPSIRTKSARGFDLAADTPPQAPKPPKLRLDPTTSLDEVFSGILRSCLLHLLQSLPVAEDGRDPEGMHQLRVALRRLRSALDLMRSVVSLDKLNLMRAEAKWLAGCLSGARDWDVFRQETLRTVADGCPSVAGFDALGALADERRTACYDAARLALADRRCQYFVIGLGGWIEARGWRSEVAPDGLAQLAEPAINFARSILSAQHAKVLKRGRRFKSLSTEERHRVRLAAKKLRYVADFLLPLCGQRKSAKRFSRRLADLQQELGIYNDIATTTSLLADVGAEATGGSVAAAAIAGWQAHAMVGVEARLREAWSGFTGAKVPWSVDAAEQPEKLVQPSAGWLR
ncbi:MULTISPECIES: CYTH and CHAD domain-containing protein [unclassified Bradyrhizobium]|uniref:CYTH and CHAD domain-containing protein n=1 Tax=unclassified Bradyrhizobium TaxID=2631580 RepID=UPI00188D9B47|nr:MULTISPECIES: CYTH and CHAD domain-containing protein [unclassified Bradyrhizobium]MDN4981686.1 CHAD domain-containing protein [Bradyrhizobium sp. WYCCWR 13022]QOZ52331.1 inorganic triphosphatase [Bradyrhizobium sp. CCBAU 53338]